MIPWMQQRGSQFPTQRYGAHAAQRPLLLDAEASSLLPNTNGQPHKFPFKWLLSAAGGLRIQPP
jgi:hypothetical protein